MDNGNRDKSEEACTDRKRKNTVSAVYWKAKNTKLQGVIKSLLSNIARSLKEDGK